VRRQHVVAAAVTMAILGASACSADSSGGAPAAAASARTPSEGRLRDGLLTRAQLPAGFRLTEGEVNSTTTGAPHRSAPTVPIASMPCSELGVESFMTAHARPVEDVAVGLEQEPVGGPDDEGWFGQEALDRYAPGQAAEVMAAIRAAAQRCTSFATTLAGGTQVQEAASVTGADVPADDSLVLRITSTHPGTPDPFVTETAFVREGDVIVMVQKVVAQKPPAGVEAVLPRAVAAYRASVRG